MSVAHWPFIFNVALATEIREVSSVRDIVFIHGGHQGSWVWNETIAELTQNEPLFFDKIVALDVPGCGKKVNLPKPDFTANDIASELAQEIIDAGIRNAIIVSHSQGGTLVPRIISKTNDCFSQALFITTAAPLEGQTILEMLGSGIHGDNEACVGWPLPIDTTEPAVLFSAMFKDKYMSDEMLQFILERSAIDAWPSIPAASDRHWGWSQLQNIKAYYLLARNDNILTLEWQEKFASRVGNDTRKFYVEAGHQVMQTQPRKVANIIREIANG